MDFGGFGDAPESDANSTAPPSLFPRLNLNGDAGGATKTDGTGTRVASAVRCHRAGALTVVCAVA